MRSLKTPRQLFGALLIAAAPLAACEQDCADCEGQLGKADGDDSPPDDAATRDTGMVAPGHRLDAGPDGAGASDDGGHGWQAALPDGSQAAADAGPTGTDGGSHTDSGPLVPPMHPADLLDLRMWKLTVPVDTEHQGSPDEYRNPELQGLSLAPYFVLTPAKDGVAFRAHAGGATTISSSYPRSELREMSADGTQHAAWSTSSGRHTMKVRQAITHLTPVKPHVVAAQIHDAADDVVMVRLQERHLYVESNGSRLATLDEDYALGTVFTLELVAENGIIQVFYQGALKASVQRAAVGCYFKAGCYTQSNVARGEEPEDFAQVVIHELSVIHE